MKSIFILLNIFLTFSYNSQNLAVITRDQNPICKNGTATLSSANSIAVDSPILYSIWNITGPNSYNYIDSTLPGLDLTINNITTPGSYSVALINQHQNGTTTVDQEINFLFVYGIDVSFSDILQGSVEVENHLVYCPPVVGNFSNTSTSFFPFQSFEWQFNNQNLSFNHQIDTIENPNGIQFLYPGNIDLQFNVIDSNQCVDTLFIQNYLEIIGPIAECHSSQTGNSNNLEYEFSVSNLENVASLEWHLGNGEIIYDMDGFTYIYNTIGIFNAFVNAEDLTGCVVRYPLGEIIPGVNNINQLEQKKISIHPNPSADFITFQSDFDTSIAIWDINGNEISKEMYSLFEDKIDIQNLKSGVYFLNQNEFFIKFIKL